MESIEKAWLSSHASRAFSGPGEPPLPTNSPEEAQKLRAAVRTLGYVTELLEKQETTLEKLRQLLCRVLSAILRSSGPLQEQWQRASQ